MINFNNIKWVFILLISVFFSSHISAQILNSTNFGFENTSVADWTQTAGFEEETTIVASGFKSAKAALTYPVSSSPKLQTWRNKSKSNGVFELKEGNHEISVMVYLEGDVPSGLLISPTGSFNIPRFSLAGVAKGQWVKLIMPFVVTSADARDDFWLAINFTGLPSAGNGIVYIDDIVIEAEVIEELPAITKIETEENINLGIGKYDIKLNVWVDPAAEMSSFYTYIENPWTAIKWDLNGIAKGEWVTLNADFVLKTPTSDSKFRIQVNNNPQLGGGKGIFYIDDISIEKDETLLETPDNFTIEVTSETCSDKNNGKIKITSKVLDGYVVDFNGTQRNFSDEILIENIEPGTYDMCIKNVTANFEQCYVVKVEEGELITASSSISSNKLAVNIEKGTAPFDVLVNGKTVFKTSASTFSVNVNQGDLVEVKTEKNCEGTFSKMIDGFENIQMFPNPATEFTNINIPENSTITLYDLLGNLVKSMVNNVSDSYEIPLEGLSKGMYILKIETSEEVYYKKLLVN